MLEDGILTTVTIYVSGNYILHPAEDIAVLTPPKDKQKVLQRLHTRVQKGASNDGDTNDTP